MAKIDRNGLKFRKEFFICIVWFDQCSELKLFLSQSEQKLTTMVPTFLLGSTDPLTFTSYICIRVYPSDIYSHLI